MNDRKNTETAGWGWPFSARKAHFFNGERTSVCGKWKFDGPRQQRRVTTPQDCRVCAEWFSHHQRRDGTT